MLENTQDQNRWSLLNILQGIAIGSGILGLGIFVGFFIVIGQSFDFEWKSPAMDITGQIGDYIGGVVGSLWAFAGVLLFYVALQYQRKEFRLQRLELSSHRTEFILTRITNIIYRQARSIESQIINLSDGYNSNNGIEVLLYWSGSSVLSFVSRDKNLTQSEVKQLDLILDQKDIVTYLRNCDATLTVYHKAIEQANKLEENPVVSKADELILDTLLVELCSFRELESFGKLVLARINAGDLGPDYYSTSYVYLKNIDQSLTRIFKRSSIGT